MIDPGFHGKTRGSTVNWAAVAGVLAMTTSAAADEPTVLSDLELDAITAAGVLIDVGSIAAALGDYAHTQTDANTFASGGEHFDVGVGITMGQAFACCGEQADVEVGSAVLGSGDIVHRTTRAVEFDGPRWKHGFSAGFVVAISFEEHFVPARDGRVAMLEELRAALAGFRFELPDAVMVGAQ
jgi:hypothetical protein